MKVKYVFISIALDIGTRPIVERKLTLGKRASSLLHQEFGVNPRQQ